MTNPFSHLDDEKLMELYKNGESKAFEVIYYKYKNHVYSYLNKRLIDKNLIDDIFQKIFLKFHKSRHLYDEKYTLIKWIYIISRSVLLDDIKKKKVKFIEFNEDYLSPQIDEKNSLIDLDSEKSLTEKEKEALKLRYYSDKEFLEISEILKTSEVNSRKIVSRALKKIKAKFIKN
ncbi:MAG: RNA polymerase sigma factor [Bacteriovoracaceae bacterium]